MLRVRACGLSDVGRARTHNEDCFEIDPDHRMFVVADGMGGHNHGEVASRIAVKAIHEFVEQTAENDTTWPFVYDARLQRHTNRLKTAIRMAHDKVLRAIRHDGSLIGMGTTVVGFLLKGRVAAIAHVGDSRVYRLRERQPRAAHPGPHLGQRAGGGRLPLRGAGARAPAQERGDARARRRERGGGRRARGRGRARRRLPPLLGRPHHHALRRRDPAPPRRDRTRSKRSAAAWCATPTPGAASTTSPWCCCDPDRPRRRDHRAQRSSP